MRTTKRVPSPRLSYTSSLLAILFPKSAPTGICLRDGQVGKKGGAQGFAFENFTFLINSPAFAPAGFCSTYSFFSTLFALFPFSLLVVTIGSWAFSGRGWLGFIPRFLSLGPRRAATVLIHSSWGSGWTRSLYLHIPTIVYTINVRVSYMGRLVLGSRRGPGRSKSGRSGVLKSRRAGVPWRAYGTKGRISEWTRIPDGRSMVLSQPMSHWDDGETRWRGLRRDT